MYKKEVDCITFIFKPNITHAPAIGYNAFDFF